jgi:hypothetical protein
MRIQIKFYFLLKGEIEKKNQFKKKKKQSKERGSKLI